MHSHNNAGGSQQLSSAMADMSIRKGPTPSAEAMHAVTPTSTAVSPAARNVWQDRSTAASQRRMREEAEARERERAEAMGKARIRAELEGRNLHREHRQPAWNNYTGGPVASQSGYPGLDIREHASQPPSQSGLQHNGHPPVMQQSHGSSMDPYTLYKIQREQNCRPDQSFTGRMHHYILQVLLPPIMPLRVDTDFLEIGRRIIEGLVQEICPGSRLVPFGSLVNNLALRNSDLDLCLVLDHRTNTEEDERTPREILEQLGKRIRKEIPYLYCQYKTHARIPIIKLYARRQHGGGIGARWNNFIADISVGNLLAIYNTRLIKAYTQVDDRYRCLVLFLKLWTARRKINEAFHGTLSSYGWALMAAHFMMYAVEPPILSNLQDIERPREPREEDIVDGFDTYFFNDLPRLSEHFTTLNPSSLGTLIKLFFIYYAGEQSPTSFNYSTDVISLRRKGVKKEEKGWMDDHERDHNHICIEDPFKTDYNVGRVVQSTGFELIRYEIRRAKDIILSAEQSQQYVGHAINHLLEPGEGIVRQKARLRAQAQGRKGGSSAPQLPAGLADLPVLNVGFKATDFPPLA